VTTPVLKPIYIISELGELGQLPDGSIINIGGTAGPTFTVGGRGLLFDDGTSTGGGAGGGAVVTLQSAYTNSGVPAQINTTSGKNIVFNALNQKKFIFNAETGLVIIEGDLNVLGDSNIIDDTVANLGQVNIRPPLPTTVALTIEPLVGVSLGVDLIQVKTTSTGPFVFRVDAAGVTHVTDLVSTGLINGVDLATLNASVVDHLNASNLPAKHTAAQISVVPIVNLPGSSVQEVLNSIGTAILASGTGTVTSVGVTSTDLTVTGSPITTAGVISLVLNTVPVSKGGTGAITAPEGLNNLLPPQTGNATKVLTTDGVNAAWGTVATATSAAGLFFLNAAPTTTGIVGAKEYVPGTIPANKVLTQATTDTDTVTVTLFAEGAASFYSPTVTVTTVPPQAGGPITATLVEDAADKRTYAATAALVGLTVDTTVTAVSSTGSTATLVINRAVAGPAVVSLTIGPYPGVQTAVKAGDVLSVTGTAPNAAVYVELLAAGAAAGVTALVLDVPDSAGLGFRSITGSFIVSGLTGLQGVQARGRNSLGTYGTTLSSANQVLLDQVIPIIGARTITYPAGQQALKASETATINALVSNFSGVSYTGVNLAPANPTLYELNKVVTRTGDTYSYNTPNYTITATKAANASSATASSAVTIAAVAPVAAITIVGNPPRLTSSPTGTNYVITITANQRLLSAPVLAASSGTWLGAWTGGPISWTRTLQIVDADPKGVQTFSGLQVTGLAGMVGTTITAGATYLVGGFSSRNIIFPAFARYAAIGVNVSQVNKVTATYTGASVLTYFPDTQDHFQGFTIVNSLGFFDPLGDHLFISDAAFAGSNTSGTLSLTIVEVA